MIKYYPVQEKEIHRTLQEDKSNIFIRIFSFYYDGFRTMTWGKKLWVIILIKLFIIFVILKYFFFPDFLETKFESDQQRSNHVLEELTNR